MKTEVSEGPLGEYTGYMTPASERPIARVKAITHRKDPYFQVLLTGKACYGKPYFKKTFL